MASKVHREKAVRQVTCMCGQPTCGVGKDAGQLRQAFLAKFGDSPETRAVDRRVRAMVPAYHGHLGR